MLEKIKLLLGLTGSDKDELITILIQETIDEIANYCHTDNICGLENCVNQIVVYKYEMLGSENLNSESYSGVNYSYRDWPDNILRQLNSHRKVRFR